MSIVKKLQGLKEAEHPGNELSQAVDGVLQAVERLAGFVDRTAETKPANALRDRTMTRRLQQMHVQIAGMVEEIENDIDRESLAQTDVPVAPATTPPPAVS